jgi:hypothetical protein
LLFRIFVDESEKNLYGVSRQQYDHAREMLGDLLEREGSEAQRFLIVDSQYIRKLADSTDGPPGHGA